MKLTYSKLTIHNRFTLPRAVVVTYGLIFVFLFAQSAALIHSEVHLFHEHTEACDKFESVENQTLNVPLTFIWPQLTSPKISLINPKVEPFYAQPLTCFDARAPPFLIKPN